MGSAPSQIYIEEHTAINSTQQDVTYQLLSDNDSDSFLFNDEKRYDSDEEEEPKDEKVKSSSVGVTINSPYSPYSPYATKSLVLNFKSGMNSNSVN